MSVTRYRYVALDTSGQTKRGRLEAGNEQQAYGKLAEMGLTPIKLREPKDSRVLFSRKRATLADIAGFTRELSVLVEARIPLAQGIRGIAEGEKKPDLRRILLDVAASVESGTSVSKAIEQHEKVFGDVYVQTLGAAEHTGSLAAVTALLADMLERKIESGQQLKSALTYPVVVIGVVIAALTVILMFVIPRFSATFASSNIELPLITVVIQALALWLRTNWMFVLAGVVISGFGLRYSWRTPRGRAVMERLLLKVPVFGKLIAAVTTGRFARVFGLSLRSGIDVVESLEIGGASTGRPVFATDCEIMADRLRTGDSVRDVLVDTSYLPGFAQRMLSAGKDSKELANSCDVVARHYERESEHLTNSMSQLLEPLLTVCLAVVVLLVALSVFLPMWKMVSIAS